MVKQQIDSVNVTKAVSALSAEQAYDAGNAVVCLMKKGLPTEQAINSTVTIAEFIRRGQAAQQAVGDILADWHSRQKSS